MAISTNDQGGIFASINITPLTDIFLVLLIIFMVATAITIESAAHVELPRLQAANQTQQPLGVTVTYTAEHQIFVNQQPVKESELGTAVSAALAKTTEKTVIFNGDPHVILGDAVRIVDIAKTAGAAQIALAVEATAGSAPVVDDVPAVGAPEPASVAPAPEPVAPGGP